jgi:hypothetical protein
MNNRNEEKKDPYIKDALVSISDAMQISEACYNIRGERKVEFSHTPDKTVITSN